MGEEIHSQMRCLDGEPDLLVSIFLNLDLRDLLAVELVCTEWRCFFIDQNIWRRKLKLKKKSVDWKYALEQHQYTNLDHASSKKLYVHLSSVFVTNLREAVTEKPDLDIEYIKYTLLRNKVRLPHQGDPLSKYKENLFFEQRFRTQMTIFEKTPEQLVFYDYQSHYVLSKLLLFGPSSFPILKTRGGSVLMAGAYYGKGRVIVVPHEGILSNYSLMDGAVAWVGGPSVSSDQTCNIAADPDAKAWTGQGWSYVKVGKNLLDERVCNQFVKREEILTVGPSVYISRGHYDDHYEKLLTYVRNGGGLIIGGHAWFWASENPTKSLLLDHPGNKWLSYFGIAFSKESIDHEDAKVPISTMEIPTIKLSYYFFAKLRSLGMGYSYSDEPLYEDFSTQKEILEMQDMFRGVIAFNRISISGKLVSS